MASPETKDVCREELQIKERNLQEYLDGHPEIPPTDSPRDFEELIKFQDEGREARFNHLASKSVLNDVEAALLRLERGTFGKCVECLNEIGDDRLRAMPWVSRCKPCQEKKGLIVLGGTKAPKILAHRLTK